MPMTFEEFEKEFTDIACTEWSKQNEHGISYTDFWKAEEGSYEKENAWTLTFNKNCKCLFELPYPKKLILNSVKHGCSNRLECVRYSNFFCEWIKRKIEIMNEKSN